MEIATTLAHQLSQAVTHDATADMTRDVRRMIRICDDVATKGDDMYAIFRVINVKPEHIDKFRDITIREARSTVGDEPGVFQFHILADADVPSRFYYFEIFRDEAAAQTHWETENFKTWRAMVGGMLEGAPQRISTMQTMFPSDHGLEQQKVGLVHW